MMRKILRAMLMIGILVLLNGFAYAQVNPILEMQGNNIESDSAFEFDEYNNLNFVDTKKLTNMPSLLEKQMVDNNVDLKKVKAKFVKISTPHNAVSYVLPFGFEVDRLEIKPIITLTIIANNNNSQRVETAALSVNLLK